MKLINKFCRQHSLRVKTLVKFVNTFNVAPDWTKCRSTATGLHALAFLKTADFLFRVTDVRTSTDTDRHLGMLLPHAPRFLHDNMYLHEAHVIINNLECNRGV
jgi:hypothetical protein